MKFVKYLSVLVFVICFFGANAQDKPVTWSFSAKQIKGVEYELKFKATILPKWHLYAQNFPDGGPIKLVFKFSNPENYIFVGKVDEITKPTEEKDEIFEINVKYFKNNAEFKQIISLKDRKLKEIKGEINGQACYDDGKCIMVSQKFVINLK